MPKQKQSPLIFNIRPKQFKPKKKKIERSSPHQWTLAQIEMLGTMVDPQLAKIMGVREGVVVFKRHKLGIPAYQPYDRTPEWTLERIALLGTMADKQIAKELGIGTHIVRTMRTELKIPPYNSAYEPSPAPAWTDGQIALLGTQSDAAVAKLIGTSYNRVIAKRKKLNVPAFRKTSPVIDWTPELIAQLGTMPDRVLAEKMGTRLENVNDKRNKLGIPSHYSKRHGAKSISKGKNVTVVGV